MNPQVVVLAGGASSRFYPFNQPHKSLVSVCGKPVLIWILNSIKSSGLNRVLIVVGSESQIPSQLAEFLPDDMQVDYVTQPQPLGAADALFKAQPMIDGPFFVVNAQNWRFHHHVLAMQKQLEETHANVILNVTRTDNPEKYGMVGIDGSFITQVIEKPSPDVSPSDMRIVGVYLFQPEFYTFLEQAHPGEYRLEAALSEAAKVNQVSYVVSDSSDPSLKYPWDLFHLKNELLEDLLEYRAKDAYIAPTAKVRGKVIIESGAQIHDYAVVEGPAYLGKNSLVGQYSLVRNGTVLEAGAQVERYCDVRNSLIGPNSHIHSEFLGDSLVGSDCRVGASFITANKRIDRANVRINVKNDWVDCGQNNLGVIMGNNVKIGIRVSTMPGTVIGNGSIVGPGVIIKGHFGDNSIIQQSNI